MATDDPPRGPLSSNEPSKEAMDSFTCSICLELLYKPIVTACGHMFCFWCGHHGMNAFMASSCPLCRRPFMYFPRICKLLHFMLMKAVPDEYARRGDEVRRHEEERGMFSPELAPEDLLISLDHDACTASEVNTLVVPDNDHGQLSSPESSNNSQCEQEGKDMSKQRNLTKADLSCALCHGLLYRPVVLNCGDVFCEPCLKTQNFKVHCLACGAPHAPGSVLVCLRLDQFVQSAFPAEYANRCLQHLVESTPSPDCESTDCKIEGNLHCFFGCDGCGMFPIVGDRYCCDDCEEDCGYDLCGSCYNNRGSFMGRFNQKHKPTHHMTKVPHTRGIEQVLQGLQLPEFSAEEA